MNLLDEIKQEYEICTTNQILCKQKVDSISNLLGLRNNNKLIVGNRAIIDSLICLFYSGNMKLYVDRVGFEPTTTYVSSTLKACKAGILPG